MATKVTRYQIQNLNPSQLTQQGAISGSTLIALSNPLDGGLTLTWTPSSLLPKTALHGQVLTYNAYTNTWGASSALVGLRSSMTVDTQLITATANQTVFNLTGISYTVNTNSIAVYSNGLKLAKTRDFLETGPTTVTLTRPVAAGTEMLFEVGMIVNQSAGPGTLPPATQNDVNLYPLWNGFEWRLAPQQGVTRIGVVTDASLTVSSNTTNPITSSGTFTIGLNNVALSKLDRNAASPGQVLTWNGSTASWAPSAATNYVGGVRAWVVFDGSLPSIKPGEINSATYTSKNVTSVVHNVSAGDYTINFAPNTFSNTFYAFCGGVNKNASGNYTGSIVEVERSVSSFRINTGFVLQSNQFNQFDATVINLVFFQ